MGDIIACHFRMAVGWGEIGALVYGRFKDREEGRGVGNDMGW